MPQRVCSSCTRQEEWGCYAFQVKEATATEPAVWHRPAVLPQTVDGEQTYACPRQPLRQAPMAWNRMLNYYAMYKAGFLPAAGAVEDQSNFAVEVFRVFDIVSRECDDELAKREREKQARSKGGRRR